MRTEEKFKIPPETNRKTTMVRSPGVDDLSFREVAALAAMHGELSSQGGPIDWSSRPSELAVLCVRYADELVSALSGVEGP